jgi:molecular chaperone GrpE
MTDRTRKARSVEELDDNEMAEGDASEAETASGVEDPPQNSPELAAEHAAEEELRQQMDALQSEFTSLNDRHLRLAAEFQNYRRRAESEMTETWSRAQADFVRRFLDVLDDLQRVSALDPADPAVTLATVVEGIDMVERKFARALEEVGAEVVSPVPGDRFDPATMEAVMRVPAASAADDDDVDQTFQKGYRFRSHLVRPARVSVRKHE